MNESRIIRNAKGETARINLAYAGCYAVAIGRRTLTGETVAQVKAQAARLGWIEESA